jgi:hypothetical protein
LENNPIISFSWGVGGNHLRWLLFLDNSIVNPFTPGQTIADKLNFVQTEIYNNSRSWNTWLQFELKYRGILDDQILIAHELYDWETNESYKSRKILFLKPSNIDSAVAHYFHINLGMNSTTPETFKKHIIEWNNELDVMIENHKKLDNWMIIDPNLLDSEILDYSMYKSIVDFFGFKDNYTESNLIHSQYYRLRQKSAREFCQYITSNEFENYVNFLKNFGGSIG